MRERHGARRLADRERAGVVVASRALAPRSWRSTRAVSAYRPVQSPRISTAAAARTARAASRTARSRASIRARRSATSRRAPRAFARVAAQLLLEVVLHGIVPTVAQECTGCAARRARCSRCRPRLERARKGLVVRPSTCPGRRSPPPSAPRVEQPQRRVLIVVEHGTDSGSR